MGFRDVSLGDFCGPSSLSVYVLHFSKNSCSIAALMAKETAKKTAPKTAKKAAPKATKKEGEIAVIETGGKQYIVSVGDVVEVELLDADLKEGDTVTFDKVLMVDNGSDATLGTPYIDGAKVTGTYQHEKKGTKLSIIRYKAKSNRDRKIGHRQKYSVVKIEALK